MGKLPFWANYSFSAWCAFWADGQVILQIFLKDQEDIVDFLSALVFYQHLKLIKDRQKKTS